MIRPLNKKILIRPIKEDEHEEGKMFVVKIRKDSLLKGKVLAVAEDARDVAWQNMAWSLKDKVVYFSAYGYEEVGEDVLVDSDQIWGVVIDDVSN